MARRERERERRISHTDGKRIEEETQIAGSYHPLSALSHTVAVVFHTAFSALWKVNVLLHFSKVY